MHYGNSSHPEVLQKSGSEKASALVIAFNEHLLHTVVLEDEGYAIVHMIKDLQCDNLPVTIEVVIRGGIVAVIPIATCSYSLMMQLF